MLNVFAWVCLLGGAQDRVEEWIENLSSDRVEVREEAARKLKALGAQAVSHLRKAASGPEGDLAARARAILRAIEIREMLTPGLIRAFPGVEDRLAAGGDSAWTDAFLRAYTPPEKRTPGGPELDRGDLRPLVRPALRGCRTPEERVEVMRLAIHFEFRACIPEMIALLKERDRLVVLTALEGLSSFGAAEGIPAILVLARGERGDERNHAIRALSRLRAREAVPEIRELARSPFHYMKQEAAEALGDLGVREAIPDLLPHLKDDQWSVRASAVRALAQLGAGEIAPAIAGLLQDRDEAVRERAAEALGWMGAKGEIPALVAAVRQGRPAVRARAAEALGLLGAREHARELLPVIPHMVLAPSAIAPPLAQLGASDCVPDLWTMLREHREGSGHILKILRYLEPREVVQDLLKLAEAPNRSSRRFAVASLYELRSPETKPALRKRLADEEEEVAAFATRALGEMGDPEALPEILARLKQDPSRLDCVEALGWLREKRAIPLLRPLLRDEEWRTASAAAVSLGRIGDRGSSADLVRLLSRPDKNMELNLQDVLRALGRMEAREAVPEIARLLESERKWTRIAAAEVLCRLGSAEGASLLLMEGQALSSMNALGNPEVWSRLGLARLPGDLKGSQGEIAVALAREAGLTVDDSSVASGLYPTWKACLRRLANRGGSTPVRDALDELFEGEFSYVLDRDRLRVFSRTQALEHWRNLLRSK